MDIGALAQQHHKRHPDDGKQRVRPTSLDQATVINYTSQIKRVIFILDDQVLIYRSEKSVNVIERHKILSSVLLSLRVIDQAWIYALQEDKEDSREDGFAVYDLIRLVKNGIVNKFFITKTING
jgi:hypothetical protein